MRIRRKTTGKAYPPEWRTADGVLIVPGFIQPSARHAGTYYLRFYCRWCRSWHSHGWADDEEPGTLTHRAPHCYNDLSPMYKRHGTVILVSPVPFEEAKSLFRAATESSRGLDHPPLDVETEEDALDEYFSRHDVWGDSFGQTRVSPDTLRRVLLEAAG